MIKKDDTVKLIDFGTWKELADKKGKTGTLCGTPYYLAPEIALGFQGDAKYGKKCDIWSLGVILHVMATNEFPIEAKK